jgi:hypothetical protein
VILDAIHTESLLQKYVEIRLRVHSRIFACHLRSSIFSLLGISPVYASMHILACSGAICTIGTFHAY